MWLLLMEKVDILHHGVVVTCWASNTLLQLVRRAQHWIRLDPFYQLLLFSSDLCSRRFVSIRLDFTTTDDLTGVVLCHLGAYRTSTCCNDQTSGPKDQHKIRHGVLHPFQQLVCAPETGRNGRLGWLWLACSPASQQHHAENVE